MKLKLIDALRNYRQGGAYVGIEEILQRSFITPEARRVGAEGKIHANRPNRSVIADAESNRVNHVVEILEIILPEPKADVTNVAVDVSGILKQHAANVIANQRESEFQVIHQHGVATQWESSLQIPGSGLIFRKRPLRCHPTREKAFRQRNHLAALQRRNPAEVSASGKYQLSGERVIT